MLAVIGGSGLYKISEVECIETVKVETPFGEPSDEVYVCDYRGFKFLFLPRHGVGHRLPPSKINYRANIFALKQLGAKAVLSVSAVGSLREELKPGYLTFVTDFIDFTKHRKVSFFEETVVHWSPVPLICPELRRIGAIAASGMREHFIESDNVVYVCIEGPRFSTKAESNMFREMGADIIGMTACPEVFLCKEARLGYLNLAVITDYDCWKDSAVTVKEVMEQFARSLMIVQKFVLEFVSKFNSSDYACPTQLALDECVIGGEQPDWLKILKK